MIGLIVKILMLISAVIILAVIFLFAKRASDENKYMKKNSFKKTRKLRICNMLLFIDDINKKWFISSPDICLANELGEVVGIEKGMSKIFNFDDVEDVDISSDSFKERKIGMGRSVLSYVLTDTFFEFITLSILSGKDVEYVEHFQLAVKVKKLDVMWIVTDIKTSKTSINSFAFKSILTAINEVCTSFAEMQK